MLSKFKWRPLLWIPCFFDSATYLIHIFFMFRPNFNLPRQPSHLSEKQNWQNPLFQVQHQQDWSKTVFSRNWGSANQPTTRFILQKKPHPGAQLCHSIAYILLILLTYIASCIVFCQIRAKSSSDMEDFRTIVTLAPDLVTVSRFWNRHQSFVVNSFRAKSSPPFTFGQGPES